MSHDLDTCGCNACEHNKIKIDTSVFKVICCEITGLPIVQNIKGGNGCPIKLYEGK